MLRKLSKYLLIVVALAISVNVPVSAHRSPGNCNSNRLTLSITRDKITVKQGDVLTYTVTLSNIDTSLSIACDIDNATLRVTLPAMDGTPTGQVATLTTAGSYPAGTPLSIAGTVPYTVNVNDGVTDVVAEVDIDGVLHDAPVDHQAQITKTIGTTVLEDDVPLSPPSDDEEFPIPPGTTSLLPGLPNIAIANQ